MNIKSMVRILMGMVLAVLLAAGAEARGLHRGGPGFQPPGEPFAIGGLPPYLVGMTLTADQQSKIQSWVRTQTDAIHTKLEAGQVLHSQLRALAFSADYTDDKAKSLTDEIGTLMTAVSLLRVQLDHGVYELLTADQQQELADRMAKAPVDALP